MSNGIGVPTPGKGILDFTRMAKTVKSVDKNDVDAFIHFYTNGKPDTVFVSVASFLSWKGVRVKSEKQPHAIQAKSWTLVYREIARQYFDANDESMFRREANGFLLFDITFLIGFYDEAKDHIMNQVLGIE